MENSQRLERRHSESHFYKYVKANTAKLVLREGFFLSQSPLKFNDPFDVQTGLHYGYEAANLHSLFINKLESLINSAENPVFENPNSISSFVNALREANKTNFISREKLFQETKPVIENLGQVLEALRADFVKKRHALAKRMRVLCLSETYDNVLMWSHYTDCHSGVVLKLRVADTEEEDDPLWLARRVTYTPKAVPLMSEIEALDMIFGLKKYDPGKLSYQLACIKFDVWSYENEWRFWDVVDAEPHFIGIHPKRFEAIYFGLNTKNEDVDEIMRLALSLNDKIEFFQAMKHPTEFKLDFRKV
jgi:hypothetical protein